ncbi:MAG: hypothetical protein EZS28_033755 [Streblomastix strix]|uniref:Uncharacterized protein n=1 Tax=Streblomastix strix TaxID=222440 RepID=A0A5J4UJI9_9EUKA|nr:MAG: hypothetical protein EZS28_033755 [Streblomastix strix]
MNKFRIQVQIDAFSTGRNKVLKQYCSPLRVCKALSKDGLAISWNSLLICAYPPIPLTANPILASDVGQIDITIDQSRSFRQNSESGSLYEKQKLDNSPWQHECFSGFIEQGENKIGEKHFRNCLRYKGATDQLISDVIKFWRTRRRRHALGLTRFAKYVEEQQVKISQLFYLTSFISRKHQKSKEKKRCGIWILNQIIFTHQQKKTKRSFTQILAACMYSPIAFTNLRLLELFEEVVQKVSVAQIRFGNKDLEGLVGQGTTSNSFFAK